MKESVGDFFINVATPKRIDLASKKLDSIQLAALDSILIFVSNNLRAKSRAITKAKLTENLYLRLRELVIKENNRIALIKLTKYQKEEDIELILKEWDENKLNEDAFFVFYKAVKNYPHPTFLPLLEKNLYKTLDDTHYSNEWKELYRAIASYKNNKALELLGIPFTQVKHNNIRKYHIDFIYDALRENMELFYDNLLWKLWTEENKITPDVFEYLLGRSPDKVFELSKKCLKNFEEFYEANISIETGASQNLTSKMVDLILERDKEFGVGIIRENIKKVNVHLFPVFADKAAKLKDNSFVEPLFERLEKEWNAHVYLKVVKVLIAYQDAGINERIIKIRKKNKDLRKGWGGKELDKLLMDNNIF